MPATRPLRPSSRVIRWLVVASVALAGLTVTQTARSSAATSSRMATLGPAWVEGVRLTVFGTGDGGACSWDILPKATDVPFDGFVAAGGSVWADGSGCGRFLELKGGQGPRCPTPVVRPGPFTVVVADHCPDCGDKHLDLTTAVWSAVTPSSGCLIEDAKFREIPGTWTRDMSVTVNRGSSAHWLRLHVFGHNRPVERVEVRSAAGTWSTLPKVAGQGFFAGPVSSPLSLPVSVRLTSTTGERLEGVGVIRGFEGEYDTGLQFANDYGITVRPTSTRGFRAELGNLRARVTKAQVRGTKRTGWLPATVDRNVITTSRNLVAPVEVRLTSDRGEVVTLDAVPSVDDKALYHTRVQFQCTNAGSCGDDSHKAKAKASTTRARATTEPTRRTSSTRSPPKKKKR